jgi:hypothetical protein
MPEQETSDGAPATAETLPTDEGNASSEPTIPFRQFLEAVHPSVWKNVSELWSGSRAFKSEVDMVSPVLRLHCQKCDGERAFRVTKKNTLSVEEARVANAKFMAYFCGNCQNYNKTFALLVMVEGSEGAGSAYKYGEHPSFGVPVPNKVLRLFGEDRENFIKGRQCENQGLGVGAFAYYRRVVENHKNEIFDAIIGVCETVGASKELIAQLGRAKNKTQFSEAMGEIKTGLPQGLLINGQHNPLTALHRALSVGLHSESDAACLQAAQDVRLVLADLVERMALLRRENKELHRAVQRLIEKKDGL